MRLPDPQPLSAKQRFGDRPGVEGAHLPRDLLGAAPPIDARLVLVDFGCVGRALRALRHGMHAAGLDAIERLEQQLRSERREALLQRSGIRALADRDPALRQQWRRYRVPRSICMMVTPVSRSPARIARCIGAAPRQRGSSEA